MSSSPRRRWLLAMALAASTGCARESTGFPPGVDPWDDPATAPEEWPALPDTPGTVALLTGQRLASGSTPSYYWGHGRARLDASLADVWAAIQWQPGVLVAVFPDVQDVDCEPSNRPEPEYELSYSLKEIPKGDFLHQSNWFRVSWRAMASRDAARSIQSINVRAQKVDGTVYIELMRQSVVATAAPGGGVALDVVRHINARDEDQFEAGEWIQFWVQALQAQLEGTREALIPTSTCFR